jgi:hypothetical protein
VLSAVDLVGALESTFRIIDACLDNWTPEMLEDVLRRQFGPEEWVSTRCAVIQGCFAHDIYHTAELNECLDRMGLSKVDLWE